MRAAYLVSEDGRLVNGKRIGVGSVWRAPSGTLRACVLALTLPDGSVVRDEVRRGEATVTDIYERLISCKVVIGLFAEALSDVAGMRVRLGRAQARLRHAKIMSSLPA